MATIEQFQRAITQAGDREAIDALEMACRAEPAERAPAQPKKPTWTNWAGNQDVFGSRLAQPKTRDDLIRLVREVSETAGGRIKAVGAGHSFSDILQTKGVVADVSGLLDGHETGLLDREDYLWKDAHPADQFVRVPCGASIRRLNNTLDHTGLGFMNLGGYDVQCVVSAAATSTHGSGIKLGPLDTTIASLDLVTTDGKMYRIEPEDGITDPSKFRVKYQPQDLELVQDDQWFRAVAVSMGCMGIIYAATVRVAPSYLIQETRQASTWKQLRPLLEAGLYQKHRHLEIIVHPYPGDGGDHRCVVFRRDVAPANVLPSPEDVIRNALLWFATRPISRDAILHMIHRDPKVVPWLLDRALDALISNKPFTRKSFQIYNIGAPNDFPALSGEFAFGLDRAFDATEAFLAQMDANRKKGWVQTAPISLRFVKKSSSYLSMMSGRDTMMIETPILQTSQGIHESLRSYEETALRFDGRPHWGQMNSMTGEPAWLRKAYPGFDSWLEIFRKLNHKGIFNNTFTDRLGISVTP